MCVFFFSIIKSALIITVSIRGISQVDSRDYQSEGMNLERAISRSFSKILENTSSHFKNPLRRKLPLAKSINFSSSFFRRPINILIGVRWLQLKGRVQTLQARLTNLRLESTYSEENGIGISLICQVMAALDQILWAQLSKRKDKIFSSQLL